MIHFLLKIRFKLSQETYKLLLNTISPIVENDEESIGWEEITNCNIIYLLKVTLNKEIKET